MAPMFRHKKRLILRRLNSIMILKKLHKDQERVSSGNHQYMDQSFLASIPKSERQKYLNFISGIPEYLLLDESQKSKYFQQKNRDFLDKIKKAPQRKAKTKKIVKFNGTCDIRYFQSNQRPKRVARSDSIKELITFDP